jgi:hypothetical protein
VEKQRRFLEKSQNAFGALGGCGFVEQQLRLFTATCLPAKAGFCSFLTKDFRFNLPAGKGRSASQSALDFQSSKANICRFLLSVSDKE